MAIDTLDRRSSALVDPWAVIFADGSIDDNDRVALVGQYSALVPVGGGGGGGGDIEVMLADFIGKPPSAYTRTGMIG